MAEIKSMTEVAYELLSKKKNSVAFAKLYDQVANKLNFDLGKRKAKISQFYTDLSLDKRFVSQKDNRWQLSERVKFEERYVKMDELILEDEEEDEYLMNADQDGDYQKDFEEDNETSEALIALKKTDKQSEIKKTL